VPCRQQSTHPEIGACPARQVEREIPPPVDRDPPDAIPYRPDAVTRDAPREARDASPGRDAREDGCRYARTSETSGARSAQAPVQS
jgi:hypothetical protein